MDHSVQGWLLPQNTCKCGAGAHDNYQHDENCLINVPVALMPLWRRGFEAQYKAGHGGRVNVPESLDPEADLAFAKGVALAAKKLAAKRMATSPERGIGVDLTL